MTNYTKTTLLSAALAAFLLPASAQTSSAPASTNAPDTTSPVTTVPAQTAPVQGKRVTPQVGKRAERQQDRIAEGIKSGQLTAGEANHLENKEAAINEEVAKDRAANHGSMTAAERAQVNRQQNQLSNQIYQDKRNGHVQNSHPTTQSGQRAEHQQDRIAQGINSGQLTAGETSQLENKEAAINREVAKDRASNHGSMTAAERKQVNRQQNQLSRQIYKDKHNARKQ
jgi:hypothetical protein